MTARPIIFSGPMIPPILDGRKTQTRRVVKIPDKNSDYYNIRTGKEWVDPGFGDGAYLKVEYQHQEDFTEKIVNRIYCPYGQVGDHLWVREEYFNGQGPGILPGLHYRADHPDWTCPWKSPIWMPRNFSRITLEITAVRVERLKDIVIEDAKAEGIKPVGIEGDSRRWIGGFRDYWDSINARRGYGWSTDPFVWAISFRVLGLKNDKA